MWATGYQAYAGIYRDTNADRNLHDNPILIESYTTAEKSRDPDRLAALVEFMKRMGAETKQAAVAVVIDDVFHEISEF